MGSRIHAGPFLPIFSDQSIKQEVCALPCENASRFEVKGDFMTSLYSHERCQSRRLLKRLNRPIYRQMPQVAITGHYTKQTLLMVL
jgi:hypothetical protein